MIHNVLLIDKLDGGIVVRARFWKIDFTESDNSDIHYRVQVTITIASIEDVCYVDDYYLYTAAIQNIPSCHDFSMV